MLEGRSILLVEDESELLSELNELLSLRGHRVTACDSACKAIEALRQGSGQYDVVLSDHRMPDQSGEAILGVIAQLNATRVKKIKFALLTGALSVPRSYAESDVMILFKPVAISELDSVITSEE